MSEKDDVYRDFEKRVERNRAGGRNPTAEPTAGPGVRPAEFVKIIAGMGERARSQGTIAQSIKDRKKE